MRHHPMPKIVEPHNLFEQSNDLGFDQEFDLHKFHDNSGFQYYGDYVPEHPDLVQALLLDDSMNPFVKNNPFTLPYRSGPDEAPFVDLPLPPLPVNVNPPTDNDWEFHDLVDLDRARVSQEQDRVEPVYAHS